MLLLFLPGGLASLWDPVRARLATVLVGGGRFGPGLGDPGPTGEAR